MGTPLYTTDIIPLTSRPTLTVMDDGDYFVILDTSTGKISKILRTNIQKALNISYDNTTSGLTAETVQAALDELVVNLGSSDDAILALSGRLDTLEGTGTGSVADDIAKYSVKLTKMPDGATAVYSQDAWATADGWTNIVGGASATVGGGAITVPATGIRKTLAGFSAKTFIGKVTAITAGTLRVGTATVYTSITVLAGTGVVMGQIPIASGDIDITNLACTIDWIWIGDYSYLDNTIATEASRIANQLGDTTGVGTKASGSITSNGTSVSDGDTVTIAGKTYTFKTTLTGVEGEVLINIDANTSMLNLYRAINRFTPSAYNYGGSSPIYSIAAAHPLVDADRTPNNRVVCTAKSIGMLGNSITLATTASTLTLSGSTLTGGTDDVGQKIYTQVKDIVAGGTRPAQADISDTSTIIGYENSVDVASGGTTTLPAGGTFRWAVYGYGATIASAKKGTSAGRTTLTVAGANATVWYRRIA